MMFTVGERMYSASVFSMSRASSLGVLPAACMFSISGVEISPSGRTGTVTLRSGWLNTNTLSWSPEPMRYSAALAAAGCAGPAGCWVFGEPAHAARAVAAAASSRLRSEVSMSVIVELLAFVEIVDQLARLRDDLIGLHGQQRLSDLARLR